MENFSKILNYNHMKIPFKYLEMTIGGNPRKQGLEGRRGNTNQKFINQKGFKCKSLTFAV